LRIDYFESIFKESFDINSHINPWWYRDFRKPAWEFHLIGVHYIGDQIQTSSYNLEVNFFSNF